MSRSNHFNIDDANTFIENEKISSSKNKFNTIHDINEHINNKADLLAGVFLLFYGFICLYFLFKEKWHNNTRKNS